MVVNWRPIAIAVGIAVACGVLFTLAIAGVRWGSQNRVFTKLFESPNRFGNFTVDLPVDFHLKTSDAAADGTEYTFSWGNSTVRGQFKDNIILSVRRSPAYREWTLESNEAYLRQAQQSAPNAYLRNQQISRDNVGRVPCLRLTQENQIEGVSFHSLAYYFVVDDLSYSIQLTTRESPGSPSYQRIDAGLRTLRRHRGAPAFPVPAGEVPELTSALVFVEHESAPSERASTTPATSGGPAKIGAAAVDAGREAARQAAAERAAPSSPATSAATREDFPAKDVWTKYVASAGKFSILLPGEGPFRTDFSRGAGNQIPLYATLALSRAPHAGAVVQFGDIPEHRSQRSEEELLASFRDILVKECERDQKDLLDEFPVDYAGHPGFQFLTRSRIQPEMMEIGREFIIQKKYYSLRFYSRSLPSPQSDKFFSSFELHESSERSPGVPPERPAFTSTGGRLATTASEVRSSGDAPRAAAVPQRTPSVVAPVPAAAHRECVWRYQPDPVPSTPKRPASRPIKLEAHYAATFRFSSLDRGEVAVCCVTKQGNRNIQRLNILTGSRISQFEIEKRTELLDFRPDGQVLLLQTMGDGDDIPRVEVWKAQGNTDVRVASLDLFQRKFATVNEAAFLGRNQMVTSTSKRFDFWELPTGKPLGSIEWSGFTPLVFSPTRRYLFGYLDQQIVCLDAETRECVGHLEQVPAETTGLAGAACNAEGTLLAASLMNRNASRAAIFALWDLTNGKLIRHFYVPIETYHHRWCSDRYILLGDSLLDLKHDLVVWKYWPEPLSGAPGNRFWFTANDRGGNRRLASLDAPGEAVEKAINEFLKRTPPLVKPGDTIALEVQAQARHPDGTDVTRTLTDIFTSKLERNGCRVGTGARVTLRVNLTDQSRGDALEFKSLSDGFTVPNRLLVLTYAFVDRAGTELWQHSVSSAVPFLAFDVGPRGVDPATQLLNNRWKSLLDQARAAYLIPTVFPWDEKRGIGSSRLDLDGEQPRLNVQLSAPAAPTRPPAVP